MFASVQCAYILWIFLGLFGAHRFYVGRPASGLVWLFTGGLFGIGWLIDLFLIPEFVEEHNKKVFHKQMLESGSSLLFDAEYAAPMPMAQQQYYYPTQPATGNAALSGAVAPYSQSVYYPQQQQQQQAGGGYY